jgi:hypothetical protein
MKRQSFPCVEVLEAKALLSHFGIAMARPQHHAAQVAKSESPSARADLAISLTTNQSIYDVGQHVQMTLTATNDTKHNVTAGVGPHRTVFSISQNGQVIWRSSSKAQPIERGALRPGESFTVTANWTANGTGNFVVSNKMAPLGSMATFSVTASGPVAVPVAPVDPPVAPVHPPVAPVDPPVAPVGPPVAPVHRPVTPVHPPVVPPGGSALAISLTTNQSTYAVGQNVQMTLTETNDTNHDVTVAVGPSIDGFFITQNGETIWQSNSGMTPMYIEQRVIDPGQSLVLTASWTASATGTFVVYNQMAPQGPFATFNV